MTQEIMQVSPLPPFMMNALQEADYIVHDHTHIKDPGALVKVTALVGTGAAVVDKKLLSMLPNVKLIAICGVGYDGVDVVAAKEKGIVVTHTPGVLTDDVADLAMGLMLAAARQLPASDRYVKDGKWPTGPMPLARKVSGARMGIVGIGRIGQAIAQRALAFNMSVAYTARSAKADLPFKYVATPEALAAESDYLVVITPGGAGTRKLINADVLKALGTKGILVNVARGSVVDEAALIEALQNGVIGGAGLDVFENEPNVPEALRAFPHVVLAPHIGSATTQTRQAMADLAFNNMKSHFDGHAVHTPVPECAAKG